MSQMTLLVSKVPIVIHNTRSTVPSFPISMTQNVPSYLSHLDFIPEYNICSNDVQSLSPLNNNVVPLELGDDMDELSNMESIFDVDMSIDFDVIISVEDADVFEVDINVVYVELVTDENLRTIEVESSKELGI